MNSRRSQGNVFGELFKGKWGTVAEDHETVQREEK
jgi:hypothetical protein